MGHRPFLNKSRRLIIKACTVGAAVFGGVTLLSVWIDRLIGGGNFMFGFLIMLDIPSSALVQSTGLDHTFLKDFSNTLAFAVIVNALVGAVLFGSAAAIWCYLKNGD